MKNPIKNALYSLLHDRGHFLAAILYRVPFLVPNDKLYLSWIYRCEFHRALNWEQPTTFNEKLNWLKLYDRQTKYIQMVDKVAVKDYVASVIGTEYVIPTIAVWDKPEDIEWDKLPNQFVLKTNHDGGGHGIVVCKDKAHLDKSLALKELNHSYRRSTFPIGREWPYKHIRHRILAEKYMEDESGELRDYKFFCFDGVVKALFIATERSGGDVKFDYYDADFNLLNLVQQHPLSGKVLQQPKSFELMKLLASKLTKGIPQVRVDFYEVNGKPYFGELTFFHHGGFVPFHPNKWDEIWGSWITLPTKTIQQ